MAREEGSGKVGARGGAADTVVVTAAAAAENADAMAAYCCYRQTQLLSLIIKRKNTITQE